MIELVWVPKSLVDAAIAYDFDSWFVTAGQVARQMNVMAVVMEKIDDIFLMTVMLAGVCVIMLVVWLAVVVLEDDVADAVAGVVVIMTIVDFVPQIEIVMVVVFADDVPDMVDLGDWYLLELMMMMTI